MSRNPLRAVLAAAAAAALLGAAALAQDAEELTPEALVGDWHGDIATPAGPLPFVVTFHADDTGALAGEAESPVQAPGVKFPLSDVTLSDEGVSFRLAMVGAVFEGAWDPAKQTFSGDFAQSGLTMPLTLERGPAAAAPAIEGLDGTWEGKLAVNGVELRLVLRVSTGERGTTATLDSPDQGAASAPVSALAREGMSVRFAVPGGQSFEGALDAGGAALSGQWTSPAGKLPLAFTRTSTSAARAAPDRPQTPHAPFPYEVEEVSFANPEARGVSLAGTLTLPDGEGPFPAAVLITGSGPQDRDETLLGHKPFAVLADHLTRKGIAVLRYDDRGVGGSTGDFAAATSADFASDARAAAAFLRSRSEIRRDAVGVIGHSEGGMVGPLAATADGRIAFVVMLAGPGTDMKSILLSQRRLLGVLAGQSETDLDRQEPVMAQLLDAVAASADAADAQARVRALLTPEALAVLGAPAGAEAALREQVAGQLASPWWIYALRYDPAATLAQVKVPVLALDGSLDRQVPASQNLDAIRRALTASPDVTVLKLAGLNHLFQTAQTGGVGEYGDIEETMAPAALDTVSEWITRRFAAR